MAVFAPAGQAEILRAAQKDEVYIQHLQELLADIGSKLFGNRLWIKLHNVSDAVAHFAYYAATTLSTVQTIGEEYTGIVQVDRTHRKLPSWRVRFLMVLLDCGGFYFVLYLLSCLERELKSAKAEASLRPKARLALLNAVHLLQTWFPNILTLHKGLFYLTGNFYSIAKRLTGVNYVLVHYWRKDSRTQFTFRVLGLITLAYGCGLGAQGLVRWWQYGEGCPTPGEQTLTAAGKGQSLLSCPLCLDEVRDASCTPCGHVFCWSCIMEWLQGKQECPLCRDTFHPSRVILLQNYMRQQS